MFAVVALRRVSGLVGLAGLLGFVRRRAVVLFFLGIWFVVSI